MVSLCFSKIDRYYLPAIQEYATIESNMQETILYALFSVIAVSLVSLVGVFTLSLNKRWLAASTLALIGLAVGALLGDAFIHLIPEATAELGDTTLVALLVIAGILAFFTLETFLHWHHHRADNEHHATHPIGKLILVSDGVHNFTDGLIIGASYLVSVEVGLATTTAVILHELPQEFGDFGVLLHAGYNVSKALWLNFLSALLAIAGLMAAWLLGEVAEDIIHYVLPIAAGGFIYIAASDLIPELHKNKRFKTSLVQILAAIAGIATMVALLGLE